MTNTVCSTENLIRKIFMTIIILHDNHVYDRLMTSLAVLVKSWQRQKQVEMYWFMSTQLSKIHLITAVISIYKMLFIFMTRYSNMTAAIQNKRHQTSTAPTVCSFNYTNFSAYSNRWLNKSKTDKTVRYMLIFQCN